MTRSRFKKGHNFGIKTRFKSHKQLGSDNYNWRGDDVGYDALHDYIIHYKQKAIECEICHQKKELELCNINKKYDPKTYNRNLDNWWWGCDKCHVHYDGRDKMLVEAGKNTRFKSYP